VSLTTGMWSSQPTPHMNDRHVIDLRHEANGFSPVAVYVHCVCGWESARYRLLGTAFDGCDIAVLMAEVEGERHVELARSSRI